MADIISTYLILFSAHLSTALYSAMPYLPFGIIGAWRWGTWLMRKILGLRYQPTPTVKLPLTTSIIVPVYNENPETFQRALNSWQQNEPSEIIAVIDHSDKRCIELFRQFARTAPNARMIITKVPGKRSALVTGIHAAQGDILALVDSDTIWGEDILDIAISPFGDEKVGGVTVRQRVFQPQGIAGRLFDINLDTRYADEMRFLAAMGDAITCLSGRTAIYRRSALLPLLEGLLTETFGGKRVISGDDKRLTELLQSAGWSVRYQANACVYTPAFKEMNIFMNQRLRWARNSWRSDLKVLSQNWVWKKPALALHLIDRLVQPLTTLMGPIYLLITLVRQDWMMLLGLVGWWFLSRTVKILPSIVRDPSYLLLVPAYILFNYVFAIVRIFAFFTMNQQGWITRWDKNRMQASSLFKLAGSYGATFATIGILFSGVQIVHANRETSPLRNVFASELQLPGYVEQIEAAIDLPAPMLQSEQTGPQTADALYATYQLQAGDTRSLLARRYGVTPAQLVLPGQSWQPGAEVQVRLPFMQASEYRTMLHEQAVSSTSLFNAHYDKERKAIIVGGRGSFVTLPALYAALQHETLSMNLFDRGVSKYGIAPRQTWLIDEGDGVYLLNANLFLEADVTLLIESPSVTWLKLASNPHEEFVTLTGNKATMLVNGVKISSWDTTTEQFDEDYKDGRSFIRINNGRLDVVDAEIAWLGHPRRSEHEAGVYGLSWRVREFAMIGKELTTGVLENSRLHHNYFGMYSYGANGIIIRNNEVYENVQYGLDPHDDSDNFLVEYNHVRDNGNHGIIFSKRCSNNIIRWNRSLNNQRNGIMLDQQGNHNSIYENIISGNAEGIVLWDSHNNALYGNTISNNQRGIRLNQKSNQNEVYQNQVTSQARYGIHLYGEAQKNRLWENRIEMSGLKGIYVEGIDNLFYDNFVAASQTGIQLGRTAVDNQIIKNQLKDNVIGISLKTKPDDIVYENVFSQSVDKPEQINLQIDNTWLVDE